jgi:hypothetical protein
MDGNAVLGYELPRGLDLRGDTVNWFSVFLQKHEEMQGLWGVSRYPTSFVRGTAVGPNVCSLLVRIISIPVSLYGFFGSFGCVSSELANQYMLY